MSAQALALAPRRRGRVHRATVGQESYVNLPRARRHTVSTMRQLRRATAAVDRRDGFGPGDVPAEVYATLGVWHGRRKMLALVEALATNPHVIAACRKKTIAVATWKAITINDVIDADGTTGRGLKTSQIVAGARVGRSAKAVQRARDINVGLGILVKVYAARELSKDERLMLWAERPGHQQRGIANEYAFVMAPAHVRARISTPTPGQFAHLLSVVHLPPFRGTSPGTSPFDALAYAAAIASKDAEPPPAVRRQRKSAALSLAAGVVNHPDTRRLLFGVRPGRIIAQLRPYQHGGWTASALAHELLATAQRRGYDTSAPARSPYGLLKALLADIDVVADVHLGTGTGWSPAPPALRLVIEPCGHRDCDGHGWRTPDVGPVTTCPDCPPSLRRSQHVAADETGEPRF